MLTFLIAARKRQNAAAAQDCVCVENDSGDESDEDSTGGGSDCSDKSGNHSDNESDMAINESEKACLDFASSC